jgi:aerobic-type carbon monoxide dehydrogenase small subunit (CoxS/CutS family)
LKRTINLRLNGEQRTLKVRTDETLLDVLQRDLGLHGTRETCGIGICGACTVIVNGKPLSSCLLLAPQLDGSEVLTIEGLKQDDKLHPIQEAFIENNAFQCSYCTSGMILAAKSLLEEISSPSEMQIKEYLSGNLCRCGSYVKIITAVQDAATRLSSQPGR